MRANFWDRAPRYTRMHPASRKLPVWRRAFRLLRGRGVPSGCPGGVVIPTPACCRFPIPRFPRSRDDAKIDERVPDANRRPRPDEPADALHRCTLHRARGEVGPLAVHRGAGSSVSHAQMRRMRSEGGRVSGGAESRFLDDAPCALPVSKPRTFDSSHGFSSPLPTHERRLVGGAPFEYLDRGWLVTHLRARFGWEEGRGSA